ncbi:GrpB family protein [Halobacillus sp. K22]|uniref:GrpB family protein n=1 Tax=Halobacillus sp. K22 TaxID=3457431 RepID=UPI003FCDF29B
MREPVGKCQNCKTLIYCSGGFLEGVVNKDQTLFCFSCANLTSTEKPTVSLSSYHPEWPALFKREEEMIREVLGDHALGIEHIGSTAIPGLQAKPIIDIMTGIESLDSYDQYIPNLSTIGYTYVPKLELEDRRFFKKEKKTQTFHLHLCEFGGKEWEEKLLFRDYLRQHPEELEEYNSLKNILADRYSNDRPAYTESKGPFITSIIQKAKRK